MKHLIIAMSTGYRTLVRYSIVAGDAEGFFTIDPNTGAIRTASALDHEAQQFVLLNVLAVSDSPSSSSYTQVRSTQQSEIHNIICLRERERERVVKNVLHIEPLSNMCPNIRDPR